MRTLTQSVVALGVCLTTLVGCGTPERDSGRQSTVGAAGGSALAPVDVDPGVVHVHGLGVDPADGVLYAATYSGLFRIPEQGRAERVANRAQDTMGFSVVGPGSFIGSGHPDPREDDVRPPLLGLIASEDAGRTWERLSLHGQADFHALAAAHGQVYGYDSTSGAFMVSTDREQWERRSRIEIADFAVDPSDADGIVATSARGVLRSSDGGRTWTPVAGAPALAVLEWDPAAALVAVAVDGGVHRSRDAGRTWSRTGGTPGSPEAVTVDARGGTDVLYVAVADHGILVSRDGGATFTTRYAEQPTDRPSTLPTR